MTIDYQLEAKDFEELAKLAPSNRRAIFVAAALSALFIALLWIFAIFDGDFVLAIIGTAFFVALLILRVFLSRRRIAKQLASTQFFAGPIRAEIDDSGIRMLYSTGDSFTKWEGHLDWKETDTLYVLFLSRIFMRAYPKRAFSPQNESIFRRLLDSRIQRVKM